ncbi:chorismate mutase [Mycobacterium avium]|nr:chorismate mutase [Mycobacterium avium]
MNTETVDPREATDIDQLRREIDRLDAEILAAVKRRTEVSQAIGRARMASGGTRLVHSREMKVIERYSELGPDGKDLAMLLLRLGRAGSGTDVGGAAHVARPGSVPSQPIGSEP